METNERTIDPCTLSLTIPDRSSHFNGEDACTGNGSEVLAKELHEDPKSELHQASLSSPLRKSAASEEATVNSEYLIMSCGLFLRKPQWIVSI